MSTYLIALLVGILVGSIYACLQVKSPAPPVVALIGLLGILIGESASPILKAKFFGHSQASSIQSTTESSEK